MIGPELQSDCIGRPRFSLRTMVAMSRIRLMIWVQQFRKCQPFF